MNEQRLRCFVGLELGQGADSTAIALLQRPRVSQPLNPRLPRPCYSLRYLQRFPPGTSFHEVSEMTRALMGLPDVKGGMLGVDMTGVGRAIVDSLADAWRTRMTCTFVPITITAGQEVSPRIGGGIQVPKKDLVGMLQLLLQTHRLQMPRSIPDVGVLLQELGNFRMKVPLNKLDTLEAWREGQHDDLVRVQLHSIHPFMLPWFWSLSWPTLMAGR